MVLFILILLIMLWGVSEGSLEAGIGSLLHLEKNRRLLIHTYHLLAHHLVGLL